MGGGKLMNSEISKRDWSSKSYIADRDRSRGGLVLTVLRQYWENVREKNWKRTVWN